MILLLLLLSFALNVVIFIWSLIRALRCNSLVFPGNTFNCNHPIVMELILESLRHWYFHFPTLCGCLLWSYLYFICWYQYIIIVVRTKLSFSLMDVVVFLMTREPVYGCSCCLYLFPQHIKSSCKYHYPPYLFNVHKVCRRHLYSPQSYSPLGSIWLIIVR